jgi:hypothetical protein
MPFPKFPEGLIERGRMVGDGAALVCTEELPLSADGPTSKARLSPLFPPFPDKPGGSATHIKLALVYFSQSPGPVCICCI